MLDKCNSMAVETSYYILGICILTMGSTPYPLLYSNM